MDLENRGVPGLTTAMRSEPKVSVTRAERREGSLRQKSVLPECFTQ